ncbi:hypothetical protein [Microbacterium rhizosphaerae]|uniref:Glycoside hydrolase family 38 N-terminal domain-containing protein n=1 Tax=Microbacterium rhizosphaerae TaxID=1678237 RepID=A0ABZ0SKI2_9MICO|nr:hypothetical protein [Microbacterium rhizosphaerae]WPR89335.1 hypothetical protein SM116_16465 [Microbacterium rhizosphaerae]
MSHDDVTSDVDDAPGLFTEDQGQADLRRTYPFDHPRAINGLRDRAFRAQPGVGEAVDVAVEPLLRRGDRGPEQPIRVRTSHAVTWAEITLPDGTILTPAAERTLDGARFFIPAQSESLVVRLGLPEIDDLSVAVTVAPVRPWEVSLIHHSHFDIGYTDLQSRVIVEQLAYLDDALRLAESEPEATPSAFRWSVESIWVLREWIRRRRPQTVERFMEQVRCGRIELAAMPFNMHTETCSTEELHGLLRYAREISARFGVDIPVAYQTDVPGCVAGTVEALSDAGVKYLAVAHNWAGRSVPYLRDGINLPRLFRWASPGGASVLVWQTTTAQGMAYQEGANLGFHDSIEDVEDRLPLYLLAEASYGYPYDDNCFGFAMGDRDFDRDPYGWNELHLRVMGRVGDNCPPNRRLNEIVRDWNERWEYPRLAVSTSQEFFELMDARHGDEIETFVGDWNDWWADGIGSAARHLQMNREAQAALSQATTINALLGTDAVPGFDDRLDAAWESVELFDEHTWGAAHPWTAGDSAYDTGVDQWHWKAEKAIGAQQESWLLTQEVLRAYAEQRGGAGDASIWVVNTEGTARDGLVSAFLPESLVHTRAGIRLVDSRTGRDITFAEDDQVNPVHRDAGRLLRFRAEGVPALGSLRVDVEVVDPRGRVVTSEGTLMPRRPADPIWRLDNGLIRVEVDPRRGWITSIRDLATGHELVDWGSAFGFNAYVHDRLASQGHFNHLSGFVADSGPDLVLLADRATQTHVAFEDAGRDDVSSWIRFRSFCTGVEAIVTTIRLDVGAGAVDIENRVVKASTASKESGFFAFPFAIQDPVVRYEVSGSVAGTDVPHVPGGADYMHAVRDWVSLWGDRRAVTLVTRDAPLVQLGDIALPYAPFPGTLKNREPSTVFSWIHNNLWDTNFPSEQSLDMVFRYRVAASETQGAEEAGTRGAQLAADLVRPLLAVAADPAEAAGTADALLTVDDDRVRVLFIRREPDGGILVALQSLAETAIPVTLTMRDEVVRAARATLNGERRESLSVTDGRHLTVTIPRFATTAVALLTAAGEE